mmetsp:Transcript_60072/g.173206  ORF Transcript_60072/g.173206 Transcript_60072/m.173206 type:complete len:247 (-) Transcript_60072:104-844(-)
MHACSALNCTSNPDANNDKQNLPSPASQRDCSGRDAPSLRATGGRPPRTTAGRRFAASLTTSIMFVLSPTIRAHHSATWPSARRSNMSIWASLSPTVTPSLSPFGMEMPMRPAADDTSAEALSVSWSATDSDARATLRWPSAEPARTSRRQTSDSVSASPLRTSIKQVTLEGSMRSISRNGPDEPTLIGPQASSKATFVARSARRRSANPRRLWCWLWNAGAVDGAPPSAKLRSQEPIADIAANMR